MVMCVGLILALDCKVSLLYQRSVIVTPISSGYAKEYLTKNFHRLRLTVVEVKG